MPITRYQPELLSKSALFSPVVKAGPTVYVAGQVARRADGELVGAGDIEAQTAQVFENLRAALAAAGASFEHVVRITIYLTDARFRDPFNAVQQRYITSDLPASTLLIVAGLAQPHFLVEVEAVAYVE